MAGLAIIIPRNGPGTGPIVPEPLYAYGANGGVSLDDYAYRWEAMRAPEAERQGPTGGPDGT